MNTTVDFGVVRATEVEIPRLSQVLSAAFADNPVSDWIFNGDQDAHHPAFFTAFLGVAAEAGRIEQTSDGTGVAVWIDNTSPWPNAVLMGFNRALTNAIGPHRERWEAFEHAAGLEHPTEPHWHLAFLGVLPAYHGRGHGGRLLEHAATTWLEETPAYLEATSRRLVAFYARHRWQHVGPIYVERGPELHRMRMRSPHGSHPRPNRNVRQATNY